ncbi:uncharacterized protein LOC133821591 isoform X1 [Humulus lupulus]|uniref:uncharacterized protein LOC133821591 isoform X1 n=1 Tax=Humulus lupulus TaxID=3486 RepID=UPI002B4158E9|nr:uncharacterized protein LOC133821591 isoform X1 [Humulus lupulus]
MESSMGVGFMAVFAVTGSVVLLAHQIHKRVLSDFMKDIEFELGLRKRSLEIGSSMKRTSSNKTVKFAEDVVEPSSNNKEYRKKQMEKRAHHHNHQHPKADMPINRQVLYRGIIDYKLGLKS